MQEVWKFGAAPPGRLQNPVSGSGARTDGPTVNLTMISAKTEIGVRGGLNRSGVPVRKNAEVDEYMPTYIILHEFNQENVENMEEQQKTGMEDLEALGGELKDLYVTFGQYDAVGIVDFPDDEAAAQWLLAQAKKSGLGTETLKGIPADRASELMAELP